MAEAKTNKKDGLEKKHRQAQKKYGKNSFSKIDNTNDEEFKKTKNLYKIRLKWNQKLA